jgi:hypothetical protein
VASVPLGVATWRPARARADGPQAMNFGSPHPVIPPKKYVPVAGAADGLAGFVRSLCGASPGGTRWGCRMAPLPPWGARWCAIHVPAGKVAGAGMAAVWRWGCADEPGLPGASRI